ncbi:coactosin [Plakobranchus ocellatus]|uniref:Coactosin-like protein n=1 Tax=Plakobranchus ocellatus TaxID=259542 RepID=A0AAV4C158_9GAST|nr:coactosin [Plakobranchus ocellatus]
MSTEVSFEDEPALAAAIADVRNDSSDVTYAFCGHVDGNPNLLQLLFTGTDNSEISSKMDPSQAFYGLARYETQVDMSTTVKFVYIHWMGENIPFAKRARYGVVQGSIDSRFSPYHALVTTSSAEDLTTEKIIQKLMETAFTKSKVIESESNLSSRQMRGFTQTQLPQRNQKANFAVSAVASKGASVEIVPDVYEAVARVRQDGDSATWMLAAYEGANPKGPVICTGIGEGGIKDFKACLDDSLPMYGLIRIEHTDADEITTVKFVYIVWVGTKVKPMAKAKISTHKGTFEEIFCPAHVVIFATELSDINESDIMEKIRKQGSR